MQKNKDHTHGNGKISFERDPAQTKSGGKQTALRPKSLKKNGTVVCWESCCAETKSNESKGICCKVKWLITKGRNLTVANQNSARFAAEREKIEPAKTDQAPRPTRLSALQNEARAGQKSEQRQLKNASKKTNLYRPGARTRFAAEIFSQRAGNGSWCWKTRLNEKMTDARCADRGTKPETKNDAVPWR
jgi:hypothetical protein